MRKKRRWLIRIGIFVGVLGILGIVAFLKAESWAKAYIESKYPGVTIGHLEIHWWEKRATAYNIKVDRENLKATLDRVEVDAEKNVQVFGGNVELTLTDSKADGGTSVKSIVAKDLQVIVHKGETKVTLVNVNVDANEACFETGTIDHSKMTALFGAGCAKRDKSLVKVSTVSIPVALPFDIPKVGNEQVAVITDLEVKPGEKHVTMAQLAIAPVLLSKPLEERADVPPIVSLVNPVIDVTGDKVTIETPTISVNHPWVASYPVTFEKVRIAAPLGLLKKEPGEIEILLGRAALHIDPIERSIHGVAPCGDWLDALPRPLPEAMAGLDANFKGMLSFAVTTKPPSFKLTQDCKFSCKAPPVADLVKMFRGGVSSNTYEAYDSKDHLIVRKFGPAVAGWTRLGDLPMYVPEAFVLLEDPGFPRHKGVLPLALENSLKVNLEKGGFFKGGSTITMQTAKNLWLQRHKTLIRKAEEALLTFALESCLSKEQILETYVNIIEFGPDVYGIGPAAKHYFKKSPARLTPDEAFFLASILPAPRKALPPNAGGLDRARKIMKQLAKSGFISEALVDEAPIDTSSWDLDEN
jgi:hypothetical protein